MEKIGEYLRKIREEKNISLEEISENNDKPFFER